MKHQIEPSQDEFGELLQELEHIQNLDGGATAVSLDEVIVGLQKIGLLEADFNWRAHSDFSCVNETKTKLGLPARP